MGETIIVPSPCRVVVDVGIVSSVGVVVRYKFAFMEAHGLAC